MNIFEMPVHPSADIFPMMSDEELNELAEDIKTNGLIHPVIVKNNILIDGRNRREACRIAKVEPFVTELDGQDINSFIISTNINRRHMTRGQQAMAVAMVYPEPEEKGRGKKCKLNLPFSKMYLSQARTVIKHLPDKATLVLSGVDQLPPAYKEAIEHRDSMKTEHDKLHELQTVAPELAEGVVQGESTLDEAIEEHKRLEKIAENARFAWWKVLKDLKAFDMVLNDESVENLGKLWLENKSESEVDLPSMISWYQDTLDKLSEVISEQK